jgi:transcriptional regulator with XRE-family HTH domain
MSSEKSENLSEKPALKALREMLGDISQEELARRIGVSLGTVGRWERGQHPATLTLTQIKSLTRELRSVGLDVENLPDEITQPLRLMPHSYSGGDSE